MVQIVFVAMATVFVVAQALGPIKERVTVAAISAAYKENAIAADAKFKGATIEVSGLVERVDSVFGSPFVVIVSKLDDFSGVHALFDRNKRADLAALKRGDKITVKGNCTGQMLGDVVIKNSVIVK